MTTRRAARRAMDCHVVAASLAAPRFTSRNAAWVARFTLPLFALSLALTACDFIPRGSTQKNDLAAMRTTTINITDRSAYTAWVAETQATQLLGLMNVTDAELPAERGMIFAFDRDEFRSFWMRNTIIPLDIAYIRSDGTIVKTYTMQPLNEVGYHSIEPARFVLEVRAGEFAAHNVKAGDHVELPPDLFK